MTTLHYGPFENILDTWQALMSHIENAGLQPSGRCREVYLEMPEGDPEGYVTELQQPVG